MTAVRVDELMRQQPTLAMLDGLDEISNEATNHPTHSQCTCPAEFNSAVQQILNLRYCARLRVARSIIQADIKQAVAMSSGGYRGLGLRSRIHPMR